jgi:hypothetical protein
MTRGGEVVSRQAHNLKIGGAIPSLATKFVVLYKYHTKQFEVDLER